MHPKRGLPKKEAQTLAFTAQKDPIAPPNQTSVASHQEPKWKIYNRLNEKQLYVAHAWTCPDCYEWQSGRCKSTAIKWSAKFGGKVLLSIRWTHKASIHDDPDMWFNFVSPSSPPLLLNWKISPRKIDWCKTLFHLVKKKKKQPTYFAFYFGG